MERWQLRPADPRAARAVADALALPPPLARVLVARGLSDVEQARRFLQPRLAQLTPPTTMADLAPAVERLAAALEGGERVAVFGDYDVDGVSSAALVGDYLGRCGGDPVVRVARRQEGYGFRAAQADELAAAGAQLVVLTDCGTSDHASVERLTGRGIDVIAIDHHRVGDDQPRWPGLALVNPQRPDCRFPYKGLSAVGLAFYVMAALRRRLERAGREVADPRENLDLVALGTLADVAPLDGDNRILVARGLHLLARTGRPGLRELLRLSELSGRAPTASDVGWRLGPRLNAPGRLGDASVALECLWQRDVERAVASARRCDEINRERRELQQAILEQAREQARQQLEDGRSFLLVGDESWHPGVIGIVAGRLADEFARPAAVVAFDGDEGRGSARSVDGLDLYLLLRACADKLRRFGGHAAAAGFSVARAALPELASALHEVTAPRLAALETPRLEVDGLLPLAAADLQFCQRAQLLGPHGARNPTPIFACADATVESVSTAGKDHLVLVLRQEQTVRRLIGFGMAARAPEVGARVDVAFAAEIDEYLGPRPQLRLVDWALGGTGIGVIE